MQFTNSFIIKFENKQLIFHFFIFTFYFLYMTNHISFHFFIMSTPTSSEESKIESLIKDENTMISNALFYSSLEKEQWKSQILRIINFLHESENEKQELKNHIDSQDARIKNLENQIAQQKVQIQALSKEQYSLKLRIPSKVIEKPKSHFHGFNLDSDEYE